MLICGLIARGKFKPELENQAGTSSYVQAGTSSYFQADASSYHAQYKYSSRVGRGTRGSPEDHLYNRYEYQEMT